MASGRDKAVSVYQCLYKVAPAERSEFGWPLCVYCGDPADTVDHVPPITRVDDCRALCRGREQFLLVKACRPCNTLLKDDLQVDIFERIDAVKYRLKRMIKKDDHALSWSEEELEGLGKNLRSKIVSAMKRIEEVQRRIDYRGGYRAILGMAKEAS